MSHGSRFGFPVGNSQLRLKHLPDSSYSLLMRVLGDEILSKASQALPEVDMAFTARFCVY